MRASPCLLRRSFWGRSMDEFNRLSKIALNLEGVKGPSGPYPLYSFHNQDSMEGAASSCDAATLGGYSKANFDWIPPNTDPANPNGHVRFHGSISTRLPKGRPDVERSGYAMWRTLDRGRTIFGKSLWDVDPWAYLALRVKSDGRAYHVNIQTESIEPTDLHQHRLFVRRPGEWETVLIRFNDFVRTNHGWVVEPQTEMLRQKLRTVGIGLTDRVEGPFDLSVERIWATNDHTEATAYSAEGDGVPEADKEGQLKDKNGKTIRWTE